jgi:hypothetical protein
MLVTLSGIVIEVRLLQPENTELPMLVTPSGIVIEVRLVQLRNASLLIPVTLFKIITVLTSAIKALIPVRQFVVPAMEVTVSVPVANSKLHPSPEKYAGGSISIILYAPNTQSA